MEDLSKIEEDQATYEHCLGHLVMAEIIDAKTAYDEMAFSSIEIK